MCGKVPHKRLGGCPESQAWALRSPSWLQPPLGVIAGPEQEWSLCVPTGSGQTWPLGGRPWARRPTLRPIATPEPQPLDHLPECGLSVAREPENTAPFSPHVKSQHFEHWPLGTIFFQLCVGQPKHSAGWSRSAGTAVQPVVGSCWRRVRG